MTILGWSFLFVQDERVVLSIPSGGSNESPDSEIIAAGISVIIKSSEKGVTVKNKMMLMNNATKGSSDLGISRIVLLRGLGLPVVVGVVIRNFMYICVLYIFHPSIYLFVLPSNLVREN